MRFSIGALKDGRAKHIRDKHNVSNATSERQPHQQGTKQHTFTTLSFYLI